MYALTKAPSIVESTNAAPPEQSETFAIPKSYFDHAMAQRRVEQFADGTWFMEIPGFEGVWADGPTAQETANELQDVLLDWVVLRVVARDRDLPIVDGINLNA